MFSADNTGHVVVWYVPTWVPVCNIMTSKLKEGKESSHDHDHDHGQDDKVCRHGAILEVDRLIVSDDNTILVAMDNARYKETCFVQFWEI
jgi:hypothetical protein